MRKDYPKVSVMIITYNQEHFIRETLDSVVSQNYPNLEIVVADDCSKDATPEIIIEYQQRYPNMIVPVLNPKNLGITGNCNAAFFACTGEFVAVMGGDDLFLPEKILRQVEQFEQDPEVVISYHPVEIFNSADNKVLYVTNQLPREDLGDAYEIIAKGGIPGASSVMVRRGACPAKGFDERLPVVSDWLFYIEVALQGKVVKLDGVYGKYRKHGSGASERTYELLSESLQTLELLQVEHPDDVKIMAACKQGKARYLAGEVYRQLQKGNGRLAYSLAKQTLSSQFKLRYLGILMMALLVRTVPYLSPLVARLLHVSKSLLKRKLA